MEWISVNDRLPADDDFDQYDEIAIWRNNQSLAPGMSVLSLSRLDEIDEYTTHWAKIKPPQYAGE